MNKLTLNSKATRGLKTNPWPNGTPGSPDKAGQYYFKSTYKGDGQTFTEEDLSKYSAKGMALGKKTGSTGPRKDYNLPATLFKNPITTIPEVDDKAELDVKNKQSLKRDAYCGLKIMQTVAPFLNFKTGGSPAGESTYTRTKEELLAAAKEKNLKKGTDEFLDFILEPSNRIIKVQVPAIPAGDVNLKEVIEADGVVSISHSEVTQIVQRVTDYIRNTFRAAQSGLLTA